MSSRGIFSPSPRASRKRIIYAAFAIFFVLLGCISAVLLITYAVRPSGSPTAGSALTTDESQQPLSFLVKPLEYASAQWDGYGPGYDGDKENPSQVWMSRRGILVYSVPLPHAGPVAIAARLSSELKKTVSTNQKDSSDVTLYLNGQSLGSKRIIADDGIGQEYTWNGEALNGTNSLKFAVDSGLTNGLVLYGPIRLSLDQRSPVNTVQVDATKSWQDSGLHVEAGATVTIDANGSVIWDEALAAVGPEGTFTASTVQNPRDFPIPEAGCGSLVMRVGRSKYAVGRRTTVQIVDGGAIELMVNDRVQYLYNNRGSFTVNIRIDR